MHARSDKLKLSKQCRRCMFYSACLFYTPSVFLSLTHIRKISVQKRRILPDTSHWPPLLENSMALTQPKWPSMSFLKRLEHPASLRRWNSSFSRGCPPIVLRERNPTALRMPQPRTSFISPPVNESHRRR